MPSFDFMAGTTAFAFFIPFRDLAPFVDDWRERTCTSKPSHGLPPHVTLLIPAPPDVDRATRALADFSSFDVSFTQLGRFPGTLWLAPQASEPFVAMTEALVRQFPKHLPYGGTFEAITPHLTVAQGNDLADAEAALTNGLPLQSRASSVALFEQVAPNRWHEVAEFAL